MGAMDFGANVTPRFATETVRDDGKRSVVYGNEAADGRVVGPHGHTVVNAGGEIDYARTIGQNVLRDTGK